MKFKEIMIILLIFVYQINGVRVKSKSKAKSRLQLKARNNKSTIKNLKKNGPLSWELLTDDKVLEQLINDNTPKNPPNLIAAFNPMNNPPNLVGAFNPMNNPSLIQNKIQNIVKSDNQKSSTFRTVGPNENSTINNTGQKYSTIFSHKNNRVINAGYYGRSRLTR
jgi:hypothetical protein